MPDVPLAPDEVAALRAANARLREVLEARDAEVAVLRAQAEGYQAQLEELRAEVEALRARLAQNPRNSSKPPSSEGLAKPAPRSLRNKSSRRPGRPKGQPGATLELTGRPDEVVTHEPGRCAGCGAGLFGAPVTRTEPRQVVDLPEEIRALVTEHQIISRRCCCGRVTAGVAPPGVAAPVQYGPRITAVCVLVAWAVPVPQPHLPGDGRAVRRPGVAGRGRRHDQQDRRLSGRLPGGDPEGAGRGPGGAF